MEAGRFIFARPMTHRSDRSAYNLLAEAVGRFEQEEATHGAELEAERGTGGDHAAQRLSFEGAQADANSALHATQQQVRDLSLIHISEPTRPY